MKRKNIDFGHIKKYAAYFVVIQLSLTLEIKAFNDDFESIEGNDLESFKDVGWQGTSNSKPFDKPSGFKLFVEPLNSGIIGKGVWFEDGNSSKTSYSFNKLVDMGNLCEITVKVKLKYYTHNAAAYVFPCKDGPGESKYCYLEPSKIKKIEWTEKEIEIVNGFEEIKIELMILLGGYVVFDYVTILYKGKDCDEETTTTEEPGDWSTEPSTETDPTTTDITETSETDDTEDTWHPLPTTIRMPVPTPTTATSQTTDSSVTDGDSEELPETTDYPTEEITTPTEDPSTEITESSDEPSTTEPPSTGVPPVFPGDDTGGLGTQEILLFIVLPTVVGIGMLAFLSTVFYFGIRKYRFLGGSKYSRFSDGDLAKDSSISSDEKGNTNRSLNPSNHSQRTLNPLARTTSQTVADVLPDNPNHQVDTPLEEVVSQTVLGVSNEQIHADFTEEAYPAEAMYNSVDTTTNPQSVSHYYDSILYVGEYSAPSADRPLQLPRMRRK